MALLHWYTFVIHFFFEVLRIYFSYSQQVQNGDLIEVDVKGRRVHLHVPDEKLQERRKHWKPVPPRVLSLSLSRITLNHSLSSLPNSLPNQWKGDTQRSTLNMSYKQTKAQTWTSLLEQVAITSHERIIKE